MTDQKIVDRLNRYSFCFPSPGWNAVASDDPEADVAVFEHSGFGRLVVSVAPWEEDDADRCDALEVASASEVSDFKLLQKCYTTVAGQRAAYVEFTGIPHDCQHHLHMASYGVVHGEQVFVIIVLAEPTAFSRMKKEVSSVIRSFSLDSTRAAEWRKEMAAWHPGPGGSWRRSPQHAQAYEELAGLWGQLSMGFIACTGAVSLMSAVVGMPSFQVAMFIWIGLWMVYFAGSRATQHGCLVGTGLTVILAPIGFLAFALRFIGASRQYRRLNGRWFARELLPRWLGGQAEFKGSFIALARSLVAFIIMGPIFAALAAVLLADILGGLAGPWPLRSPVDYVRTIFGSPNVARSAAAVNNMRQMLDAASIYTTSHNGQLPPKNSWPQALAEAGLQEQQACDPLAGVGERGFAMNSALPACVRQIPAPTQTVLFFACKPSSPLSGGPELLPALPRLAAGHLIGFLDGHHELVSPENLSKLIWAPQVLARDGHKTLPHETSPPREAVPPPENTPPREVSPPHEKTRPHEKTPRRKGQRKTKKAGASFRGDHDPQPLLPVPRAPLRLGTIAVRPIDGPFRNTGG